MVRRAGTQRRKRRAAKVEVDNKIGGIKPVSITGPIRRLTVDSYVDLIVYSEEESFIMSDYYFRNNELNLQTLDFIALLNQDNEFINWRAYSSAFKITSINMSFNYARIPHSGEFYPKIVLTPETDVVDFTYQPLQEHNNMVWDMSTLGIKNYTIKLRRTNTYTEDLGWQNAANGYAGTCKVFMQPQSKQAFVFGESALGRETLGIVHITIKVTLKLNDAERPINKRGVNNPIPTKIIKLAQQQILSEKAKQILTEGDVHEEVKEQTSDYNKELTETMSQLY